MRPLGAVDAHTFVRHPGTNPGPGCGSEKIDVPSSCDQIWPESWRLFYSCSEDQGDRLTLRPYDADRSWCHPRQGV